ncbi:MAG: DNA repair protein RecN [Candidatus Omnitrophota bacterium]
MITQLNIRNFGLIDELSLELGAALNILTGETGAGKSIIIDALRFGLGEPLGQSQVRVPELPCVVEVVFELLSEELRRNPLIGEFLTGPEETALIIHREQSADGRKKVKINGNSVTISQLKAVGDHLVDFHGAHDHQLILSADSHLAILDRLTDFCALKREYRESFSKFKEIGSRINEIVLARKSRDRDLDFLAHQLKELERVPLDQAVYEQMRQKRVQLNNVEKLFEEINEMIGLFENEETGISRALSGAFGPMRCLNRIDASTEELAQALSRLQEEAEQLSRRLAQYKDGLSFEPEESRSINENCDVYEEIIRKYGPTLEDADKVFREARSRYDTLVDLEHNDEILRADLSGLEKTLENVAAKITRLRKKTAQFLKETIEKELSELGIAHARFECRLEKSPFNAEGADSAVFYLSPNAGEELKPLAEIISSGEAARLMLALKKALTRVDTVPVLIFDEIDAQIGGRLGTVTGRKLKELSLNRQVILITHLPQIASFADRHFKVSKKVADNRTTTIVDLLDQDASVKEMAKMMSGEKESRISLEHARDMAAAAKKK